MLIEYHECEDLLYNRKLFHKHYSITIAATDTARKRIQTANQRQWVGNQSINGWIMKAATLLLILVITSPAFSQAWRSVDDITKAVVDIDCDNLTQPIQQIIDDVPEDSTIKIYGTCYEPIKIKKDRLSILGMFGAKFIFSSSVHCGIAISGRQIKINGITIFGGGSGIVVYRSGSLNIFDSKISNTDSIGIEVTGSSYARITQTEISNSHRNGIVVRLSSSADIHENKISRNKSYAITIDGSSADIDGNIISENNKYGIFLHGCSKIRLGGDNVSGKSNVFYGNLIGGIRCDSNSTIEIRAEQKFDTNQNNYDLSDSCILINAINDPKAD